MLCTKQSRFLILVRDGTHVPTHDFEIRVLADIIDGHLEHPEMEVGHWAERATGDENDGLLFWISL